MYLACRQPWVQCPTSKKEKHFIGGNDGDSSTDSLETGLTNLKKDLNKTS
jgi:hypothetical protein